MIAVDVNVLVSAFRADAAHHPELSAWLEQAVAGPELLGVSDAVLVGTLRVLTHPRVFDPPTPLAEASDQLTELRHADGVIRLAPGPRHWDLVTHLCRQADARGNLVADAQHAAVAVEHGATWVSMDRDFSRFAGLRWETPLG